MKFLSTVFAVFLSVPALVAAQTPPPRPMITGMAQVSIYASDMAKARHFFGEFLGFPENGTAHQRYRVNARQTIVVDPLPSGVKNFLRSVGFATPDVEAMRTYLLDKGIQVPDKVKRGPAGTRRFWVKDPEGHRIEFIQLGPNNAHFLPVVAAGDQPISHHILHAGFIVRDRAAENHFFHEILGFRQAWEGGMKDGKTDWVDMQVPNGDDWIEYMLQTSGPVSPSLSGVLNHFALGVKNVHQAADVLRKRGWHSSPREKAQMGRDGKWQLNLYDPDGTRVELMEFRPVETPCCSPYTLPIPK